MDFWDGLEKAGKAIARGTCSYLEYASRSSARSDNFTDEQQEAFSEYADRMHDLKDRFSDD